MNVQFDVPGAPVGKQRPTAKRRRDKFGAQYVAMITPDKTVAYEELVAVCAAQAMAGREPMTGPVAVEIWLYFAAPESWSKAKKQAALDGAIRPTGKPDFDNAAKAICDACNGIAWKDDSQITDAAVFKRYSKTARTEVVARSIG